MGVNVELVNLTSNYFELFGLPAVFSVDQEKLSEQYRYLQTVVHPDKFANASDYERRVSVQKSARINEAYQILKQPLSRAQYLVEYLSEVNGVELRNDSDVKMDSNFLLQQMEVREKLDKIKLNKNLNGELTIIANDIHQNKGNIEKDIGKLFEHNAKDNLQEIAGLVNRLQFLSRIQEEISELEAMKL